MQRHCPCVPSFKQYVSPSEDSSREFLFGASAWESREHTFISAPLLNLVHPASSTGSITGNISCLLINIAFPETVRTERRKEDRPLLAAF